MYSINSEGKSVVAKRLTRTLKSKIYKYMTSVVDIVNKYSNTYCEKKMKDANVKLSTYIDFNVEKKKDNDHKFEVEEHVEIPKYKNIFCKRLHSELVARGFCDKKS